MAKEYIERDAALNASKIVYIEYIEVDGDGYEDGYADDIPVVFKKDIEAIPAADVREVVTCEECVWHIDDGTHYCNKWCEPCPDNAEFFCAYGERDNCGADMRETEPQKCDTCRHGAHWDGVVVCGKDGQRHERNETCKEG